MSAIASLDSDQMGAGAKSTKAVDFKLKVHGPKSPNASLPKKAIVQSTRKPSPKEKRVVAEKSSIPKKSIQKIGPKEDQPVAGKSPSASISTINHKYGWFGFEPSWLQAIHKPWFLLVCLCCLVVVQGFVVNGIFPAITSQLERRFYIKSAEVGAINSMYDVGALVMLLPISYYGSTGHKGRWIGIGGATMGLGSFLCLIPHLAVGKYVYSSNTLTGQCLNVSAITATTSDGSVGESSLRHWKYLFMIGNMLQGIGASPFFTLAITYLDENISQQASSTYVGIYYACSLLGPCLGYIFAGVSLRYHVDFAKEGVDLTAIEQGDSRWVGAWWLGFIVSGISALVISPFVLGFARQLPGAEEARKKDVAQVPTTPDRSRIPEVLRKFPRSVQQLWVLLRNPTYVGLIIEQVATIFVTAGMIVFLTKYIEVQFGKTVGSATLYAASSALPAAFIGTLLGTFFQRILNLRCNGNLILSIISTIGAILSCSAFFASCSTRAFAGVNAPYPMYYDVNQNPLNLNHSCSSDSDAELYCGCSKSFFDPVCAAENGTTLFSPCYAGCLDVSNKNKRAWNCSCVPGGSVTIEPCDSDCAGWKFALFLIGLAGIVFFVYLKQSPVQQATLRCVPFELRTFAVAIGWVPMRLLGTIPASPLMGAIVQTACVQSQERDGVKEVCVLYDNSSLAACFQIAAVIGFAVSFISLMTAWCFYRSSTAEGRVTSGRCLSDSLKTCSSASGGLLRT